VRPQHGTNGNIGYGDDQSALNPVVSAWPSLPNAVELPAQKFWGTLNLVGGFHMGNPGLLEAI
jgi:hypothetical protein